MLNIFLNPKFERVVDIPDESVNWSVIKAFATVFQIMFMCMCFYIHAY